MARRFLTRTMKLSVLVVGLGVLVAAPTGASAQTAAQCPVPLSTEGISAAGSIIGVLNETLERTRLNVGDSPLNQGTIVDGVRIARAVEQGQMFGGCGTLTSMNGPVYVKAESQVPVATDPVTGNLDLGVGTLSGVAKFSGSGRDAVPAKIQGTLNFVPTDSTSKMCNGHQCPFVQTSGTWQTHTITGSFIGVALVPFQYNGTWVYLDPTGIVAGTPGGIAPLQPTDFNAAGAPEAKFIMNLFE